MQFCGIKLNIMKQLLQTEELFQFLASIVALYFLPVHLYWWIWVILFLLPDSSMLGYLVNTSVGAFSYNLFHHKGVALLIIALGFYNRSTSLEVTGIILFGHAAMDRIMGFGLKYSDSFKHTHLDPIPADEPDNYKNKTLHA